MQICKAISRYLPREQAAASEGHEGEDHHHFGGRQQIGPKVRFLKVCLLSRGSVQFMPQRPKSISVVSSTTELNRFDMSGRHYSFHNSNVRFGTNPTASIVAIACLR